MPLIPKTLNTQGEHHEEKELIHKHSSLQSEYFLWGGWWRGYPYPLISQGSLGVMKQQTQAARPGSSKLPQQILKLTKEAPLYSKRQRSHIWCGIKLKPVRKQWCRHGRQNQNTSYMKMVLLVRMSWKRSWPFPLRTFSFPREALCWL